VAYGSGEGPISRYWRRAFVWCVQALLKVLCVMCPSIEEGPFLWCLEKVLSCVQVLEKFLWCVSVPEKVLCLICLSTGKSPLSDVSQYRKRSFVWCVSVLEKFLCLMCPSTTESTNWISSTSTCRIAVCHSSGAVDSSLVDCDVVQIGKHLSRDDEEAAWTASADLLSGTLLQTTPLASYTNCPRLPVAMGATVTFHDIRFAQHLQAAWPHYSQLRVSGT